MKTFNAHLSDEQLTLVYFGEGAKDSQAHVFGCAECRANYERLARFLDAMRDIPLPEIGPDWDQKLWRKISPQVTGELARGRRKPLGMWIWAPALSAILAVVFIAGMYTQRRVAEKDGAFSPNGRERVLLIAMGDHFDRSQIVLAELVNAPDGKSLNIASEQELAGGLLNENRLLRQAALRTGDRSDASVLEELERVLIEISHSPSELSGSELEGLRKRIQSQGLLFKVRVIGTNAREKGMNL